MARRSALAAASLLVCGLLGLGCGRSEPQAAQAAVPAAEPVALTKLTDGPHDVAVLEMGDLGTIRIELYPELAPKSVARFVELAEQGFYDGTYFHRVIPGFMIQGGDPNTKDLDPRNDGRGRWEKNLPDEFTDYPHLRGTVSMANTGYSGSSSCQFFIVQQDNRELDGHYTAFGKVISGMEVVDAITELAIDKYGRYGPPDRPYPVNATIEHLRIERAGSQVAEAAPASATDVAETAQARE
jgi:peptidyl-prolyl cis-trans isomerase B (cyclophilin B)